MSESSSSNILIVNNSRFKLMDRPSAIPGKCAVCGAVDRPVVDTGWNAEYYGVVYFCVLCLAEVAGIIGMVDGKLIQEAEADSARQFEAELVKRDVRVITNEQYLLCLTAIGRLHASFSDIVRVPSNEDEPEATVTELATAKTNSRTSKQKSKPVIDEGPISVPDGNVDGDNPFNF